MLELGRIEMYQVELNSAKYSKYSQVIQSDYKEIHSSLKDES